MFNYCGVKFKRGTGLGNRLFPWARCIIFSNEESKPMLWPNWFHFRKASFLKGGINYKNSLGKILLFKNFHNNGAYINTFKKYFIKRKYAKDIAWFSGDGDFFADLQNHHAFIKDELFKIVHPNVLRQANLIETPKIILNIRRGKDFSDAKDKSDYVLKGAIRTPLAWFKLSLLQIREMNGNDVPALIISDGNALDLQEILALPNVSLAKTNTAIADLVLLSDAKVILGSGGSSFTAWGSFLSKAITITIPGQSLQWFKVSNNLEKHLVSTYDPSVPDQDILKAINEKL